MPQQTNLNVAPYFDDFDASNDYHKVLFKPGYPVQARELTTLQSILQNQIEKFGDHFFKEGTRVIPGNISYNQFYYAVKLNNSYQGVPVSAFAEQLVGTQITGAVSGVSAVVDHVLLPGDSEESSLTLYVNYIGSNLTDNSSQQFNDGEELVCNTILVSGLLGNTTINPGTAFALTLSNNNAATGSAFMINEGVYFIRGQFVTVNTETLILDQYSNTPNYRVGLNIVEEIINSDLDESLNDNSQGYNNYGSPGADRLRVTASLFKKSLDDFDDNNFIELGTVKNGELRSKKKTGSGNSTPFEDDVATKIFDTDGDFTVKEFNSAVAESLDDGLGNNGLFKQGEFTYGGEPASADKMIYKMSPGKAYVRGYDVEIPEVVYLDAPKTRTTKRIEDEAITYNTGTTIKINNAQGAPYIGIGNTYFVSLRDTRTANVGASPAYNYGKEIGVARVYDYKLEEGSQKDWTPANEFNLSLYDVQTITELSLNEPTTLNTPVFIKGSSSGATGFLKESVTNGSTLQIYETEGSFIPSESLIFDGVQDGRISTGITAYGISDVKAVYVEGVARDPRQGPWQDFSGDVVQRDIKVIGIASITAEYEWDGGGPLSGICTVTVPAKYPVNEFFKAGDLVKFTNPDDQKEPVVGVVSFTTYVAPSSGAGQNDILIKKDFQTNPGIAGSLPITHIVAQDFTKIASTLAESQDDSLYTPLPKTNIASVELDDAYITIRKIYDANFVEGEVSSSTIPTGGEDEYFLPFDEERYSLFNEFGTPQNLASDNFRVYTDNNGRSALQIKGINPNNVGNDCKIIATLQKKNPKAKLKIRTAVKSIIVDKSSQPKSGIGSTSADDGLTYGAYPFGTRVQDEIISLNHPDVISLYGVFESSDTGNPSAPKLTLTDIASPSTTTADFLIGEVIEGESSGAIAIIAEILDDSTVTFLYRNEEVFKEGERILTNQTNIYSNIQKLDTPSFDVSVNYTFDDGQQSSFYDYGFIERKSENEAPDRKLKIYFCTAGYNVTDTGDITTADSYKNFSFSKEIREIDGHRNTDIIDIRPRVSDYSVVDGASRSPLEFFGRTFTQTGNTATNILASNENVLVTFSYYLGRIDRIFLNKDGTFQVNYGEPSDDPDFPNKVDDALEVCQATLPPYVYDVSDVEINFLTHKGYKNSDIRKLEDRIKNLEYYTALSLLESNTNNMFIADRDGTNRYKAGFFVDNFASFDSQEDGLQIQNSIDRSNKQLRPRHFTTSVDLIFGPVTDVDPNEDLAFSDASGINIQKSGDVLTLGYSEVEWLKQSFGTRTESVTPFMIPFWQGTIELTPAGDTWTDVVTLSAKIINREGNYAQVMANAQRQFNVDPQSGFAPTVWNSWQTTWTGMETDRWTRNRSRVISSQRLRQGRREFQRTRTRVTEQTLTQQFQRTNQARTGVRTLVVEDIQNTSQGTRLVSRDLAPAIRSRNVTFDGKRFKPKKRLYTFFDGKDVTKYCVPKLLEVSMTSGTFQVGETVIGESFRSGGMSTWPHSISPSIAFRVAQLNHQEGIYSSPTGVYQENPYDSTPLASGYSASSTLLNIDLYSLSNHPQGDYSGWIESDMVLRGQSSGAQARITNVRLIPDNHGIMQGSFYIPNPNGTNHPKFEVGTKVFTLIDNASNVVKGADTRGEEDYIAQGFVNTVQETIISVRNARVEHRQTNDSRSSRTAVGSAQVVGSRTIRTSTSERTIRWHDPLAQSFLVDDETGIYLTRFDVFFKSKDDMGLPVTVQIRSTDRGYPLTKVLPFSEVALNPDDVVLSSDGSVATSFQFKSPVYLEGGREYAVCLLSNSTKYSVFISRVGEEDLITRSYVSQQPYLGSLFKSQNASTWEPSQWEDLKFTMYRADFVDSGSVDLYNPVLAKGNDEIARLQADSLSLKSKTIRVGLGTTAVDNTIEIGNTISQQGSEATGNYVGAAGSAFYVSITNAGIGFTPFTAGNYTYYDVPLQTITGQGKGARAVVSVNGGKVDTIQINDQGSQANGGNGYVVGDVVGISSLGTQGAGRDLRATITTIGDPRQLILENVQGNFVTGVGNTVMVTRSSGLTTGFNDFNGGDVQIDAIETVEDGLHVKVNHMNHGMYFQNNVVGISGVQSDVKPSRLTAPYSVDSTDGISVEDGSKFAVFEGVGVGTTNRGYLQIGDEIIEYTNVNGNTIGGFIARSSNAFKQDYPTGTDVYKYELGGVNLKRINKTHDLTNVTKADPINYDSYHIKIDMSEKFNVDNADRSTDVGYRSLYFDRSQTAGGWDSFATQNIPFEIITPMIQNLTPEGTTINATVQTITGQSMSGVETPWVNFGTESVSINEINYLDTPRLIGSKVNENAKLNNVTEGNKSLNLKLTLNTTDSRISPIVDAQRMSAVLTSNRVNNIISDFATDPRVNTIGTDPSACKYISKEVVMTNSATSLKVIVDGYCNAFCDIRAFYAISEKDGFSPIFTPFPGYKNLTPQGEIINKENNDGRPDSLVPVQNEYNFTPEDTEFSSYNFTVDNLPSFKAYRIKFVLTSTSQVHVPRLSNLRVIALA